VAHLSPDFGRLLSAWIAPGEEEAVAKIIEQATLAGDDHLAEFLDSLAARIERHPARLRAAEVRALLKQVIDPP